MQIYVVFKIARQIDGEYVFVSAEKGFKESSKAEEFWRSLGASQWREDLFVPSGVPGGSTERISCQCERAIHTLEIAE